MAPHGAKVMKTKLKNSEAGFSLIELMIAAVVLTVGMLGSLALIFAAINDNARNKLDTTSTLISQMVIEQFNALPANSYNITSISVVDGGGTTRTFTTAVGGATLTAANNVDWTVAAVSSYTNQFVGQDGIIYDVRWNIQQIGMMKRLIVSTRRSGADQSI